MIADVPRAPRIPGESDVAYGHARAWIESGGISDTGELRPRASIAEIARARGVKPSWLRTLSGRHNWRDRAVEWDNAALEILARAGQRRNDWGALLSECVREIERRGPGDLTGSELAGMARLAAAELARERDAEAKRPVLIDGLKASDLDRLTTEERVQLSTLLGKAAGRER